MTKYTSKTGYIKRIATGEIYEAKEIFLGKFDKKTNYEDCTKEDYEAFLKEQEEKYKDSVLL